MGFAIALSFLLQAAFAPPPTAPAIATPGSETFLLEQRNYETELRQACISANGVNLIVESWTRNRVRAASSPVKPYELEYDIAEAAYAQPVDIERLERAIRASAKTKSDREAENTDNEIQLLRRLSPPDRAIYARRFTWMRPTSPAPACKP